MSESQRMTGVERIRCMELSASDPEARLALRLDAALGEAEEKIKRLKARVEEARAILTEYLDWGAMTGSDRDLFERKFQAYLAVKVE